ncbi:signal peptidase II [Tyzzerella sp. An114]|uniref:signal peptidase II n=1 Tax=Tyzzerella sp. An114 TaxID=1965545 RepID=UPI000B44D19D|nr:signal peptidase II [Tyzzerella sp. An114]OUQ59484.1 signal peptidase II [Tyzzerella sp. An114]HIT73494.1 signal peptidase II [Candidatus Fimicola cottocaccae]
MIFLPLVVTAILVVIDQITKYIALSSLKPIGSMTFIKGFMDFTFVENRGAAFGILEGQRWFFVVATIVISVAIIYAFVKMPKKKEYKYMKLALVLILAGAFGNVIDRLFRGYVVDFFEFTFIDWPVFNVADIYVVVGTIIFAFLILFVIKDEPKNNKKG